MTVPFSQVKPASLKMKVLPRYPGKYLVGPGLAVTQEAGEVTTSIDFTNLVFDDNTPVTGLYIAAWNDTDKTFKLYTSDALIGPQGTPGPANASDYETRALAAAATIAAAVHYLRIAGYTTAGDGGASLYKRVTSLAAGAFGFQSVDGSWWSLAEAVPNVKMFGAFGDGTTDDTAAIVVAVTYLNSIGGGHLFFPRGTYIVSSSMAFFSFSNITCQGAGVGMTTIKASSGGTFTNGLFTYGGGENFRHRDITFDVNNKTMLSLLPAIFFQSTNNVEVSDCEVLHISAIGIGAFSSDNIRIQRNTITLDVAFNTQNDGIIFDECTNVWIDSNKIDRTGILAGGQNVWITNNNCHDYKYGGGLGCKSNASGDGGPYYVIGNTFSGGVGVDSDSTYVAGMEYNGIGGICANNTCFNNWGVGIASFSFGSVITGNVCYGNGLGGSPVHCAGILGAFQAAGQFFGNNVVAGNTCFDTGGTQLYGYQDSGDTRCGNNTFSANNFEHNVTSPVSMVSTNSYQGAVYSGTLAYAGGTVTSGASATFNVTVPNSNAGDFAIGSLDSYAGGAAISAKAIGSSLVAVTVSNLTGSTATLPAGNFTAMVIKRP